MARALKILFGSLFFLFGLGVTATSLRDLVPEWRESERQILKSLIRQDLEQMIARKTLSPIFFDLKSIEVRDLSPAVNGWLDQSSFPFVLKTEGKNRMTALVDLWQSPETGQRGVLVQMQVFDIGSQNMVWELGRTYIVGETPSVEPKVN